MKRIAYLLPLLLLLVGCKDNIDFDSISGRSKLVVYCMPTASDTTYLRVSRSIPVKAYADSVRLTYVDNAQVTYSVNGQPHEAQPIGSGFYRVAAPQKAGDRIDLRVSAPDEAEVNASAVIPEPVPVTAVAVKEVSLYVREYSTTRTFDQLTATFTDDAPRSDYYAVRVRVKHYQGQAIGYADHGRTTWLFADYADYLQNRHRMDWDSLRVEFTDSAYSYPQVFTESEPLLMPVTELDENFGFSNDFYGNLYIFNDRLISGKTYTLHLNINRNPGIFGYGDWEGRGEDYHFAYAYQVELLRISPEYYGFLRALNDINNNELANAGLSLIRPLNSNIANGLGLLGTWSPSSTAWMMKDVVETPSK